MESSGELDDWHPVGLALVWICTDLLEGIFSQAPPRGRLRAEILSRSLCEYAITFAWIAAAETDELRASRLKQFEKEEFTLRKKGERTLVDQIGTQERYAHLFESGRFPRRVLDETTRERADALEADASIKQLPDVLQMAYVADQRWMPEIDLVYRNPFASFYFLIFTSSSFTTHASVTSVGKVVVGMPPKLVVGMPEQLSEGAGPYGLSVALVGCVLLVASYGLGIPLADEVVRALNTE